MQVITRRLAKLVNAQEKTTNVRNAHHCKSKKPHSTTSSSPVRLLWLWKAQIELVFEAPKFPSWKFGWLKNQLNVILPRSLTYTTDGAIISKECVGEVGLVQVLVG